MLSRYKSFSFNFWFREFRSPSLPVVSFLLSSFNSLVCNYRSIFTQYSRGIFIWDGRIESVTFDFCWAILNSFFFLIQGFQQFDLILYVPSKSVHSPLFSDYHDYVTDEYHAACL